MITSEVKPKKIRKSQSMLDNPYLVGPKVDLSDRPKKIVLKKSFHVFQAGKEWLGKKYEHVHEEFNFMDIFAFNVEGECCELEVKMADYDFYKERTRDAKVFKHTSYKADDIFCPNYFYFLVPRSTVKKALRTVEAYFPRYGVIEYCDNAGLIIHKESEKLTDRIYRGELLEYKYRDRKHTFYSKI